MTVMVAPYRLDWLAMQFGLTLDGPGATLIDGVQTLERAGPTQLGFFANSRYRADLGRTRAGVVVLKPADRTFCPVPALLAPDPYLAYARIAALFEVRPRPPAGIHPSAVVEPGAQIDPSAHIAAFTLVAASAVIGPGVRVGPGCVIGPDCVLEADVELVARVTLVKRVWLGARALIHPGAVLGADGFGLARDRDGWIKVPQLGGVRVGADCEIGANSTIDCGALEDTELAEDVRIDNQVQIGHNVRIGAHTAIAGCTGIAGSASIGANCMIAGACGIGGHLHIADGTTVLGLSMVTHDLPQRGVYAGGPPLMDNASWRRNMARLRHLDELARRVRRLEQAAYPQPPQGSQDDHEQ